MNKDIIPLCVPYWDERKVLEEGAKYDKNFGFYTTAQWLDNRFDYLEEWLPFKYDRRIKGEALIPDMLPVTSWQQNLRTILEPSRWDKIRKHCYQAAGGRCKVCGEKTYLEAHEHWELHNESQIQELKQIIALCPTCHKAYHIGFAKSSGMLMAVKLKLLDVNGWSSQEIDQQLQKAYDRWEQRSHWDWKLDIEYVYRNGLLYL